MKQWYVMFLCKTAVWGVKSFKSTFSCHIIFKTQHLNAVPFKCCVQSYAFGLNCFWSVTFDLFQWITVPYPLPVVDQGTFVFPGQLLDQVTHPSFPTRISKLIYAIKKCEESTRVI